MKKLLVLALVLGMVSFANAGLYLTASGADVPEVTLYPSDVISIGVAATAQTPQTNGFLLLTIAQPGEWTGTNAVLLPIGAAEGWSRVIDTEGGVDAWLGMFAQSSLDPMAVGIIGTVDFHCKGPGQVVLTLTDDSGNFIDELRIVQFPEPLTMLLLGLGGLFIRKR